MVLKELYLFILGNKKLMNHKSKMIINVLYNNREIIKSGKSNLIINSFA